MQEDNAADVSSADKVVFYIIKALVIPGKIVTMQSVTITGAFTTQVMRPSRTTPIKAPPVEKAGTGIPSPLNSDVSQFTPACQAPASQRSDFTD